MGWDVHGNKLNLRTLMNPLHTTDNLSYDITYKKAKTKTKKQKNKRYPNEILSWNLLLTTDYISYDITYRKTNRYK